MNTATFSLATLSPAIPEIVLALMVFALLVMDAFLAILAVAVLAMGLWPQPLTDLMNPTLQELLRHVAQSKLQ